MNHKATCKIFQVLFFFMMFQFSNNAWNFNSKKQARKLILGSIVSKIMQAVTGSSPGEEKIVELKKQIDETNTEIIKLEVEKEDLKNELENSINKLKNGIKSLETKTENKLREFRNNLDTFLTN